MRLDLGKYVIETDEVQFLVKEKRIVQPGKRTKKENVGKPVEKDLAYCSSFENALKFLSKRAFIDNEDIRDVVKETKVLQSKIEGLTQLFELEGGMENEN